MMTGLSRLCIPLMSHATCINFTCVPHLHACRYQFINLTRQLHGTMSGSTNNIITAKVQLHIHLDGAVRLSSVIPMMRDRGMQPVCKTEEELREKVVMTKPENLTTFLARFKYFAPAFCGNVENIRRLAREFAEDMYRDNVIYCEARYSPHLMAGDGVTPSQVVEAVCDEFIKAEKEYNIKLRCILCCMRSMPDKSMEVVELCDKFRDQGVVAIDLAGDENQVTPEHPTQIQHVEAFRAAKKKNIHRTVHAGENGPWEVVEESVDKMYAERIGHGYRTLQNETLYERLLKDRTHFECCPYSSVMTGACNPDWHKHPVIRFAADDFNFSLNTDDPTITDTGMSDEFRIAEEKIGLTPTVLVRTIFNAAKSAFLPEVEKAELLNRLHSVYDPVLPEAKGFPTC